MSNGINKKQVYKSIKTLLVFSFLPIIFLSSNIAEAKSKNINGLRMENLSTKEDFANKISLKFDGRRHSLESHNAGLVKQRSANGAFALDIDPSKFRQSKRVDILINLPNVTAQNWIVNTAYNYRGESRDLKIDMYRVEDKKMYLLNGEFVDKTGYLNVNLGTDLSEKPHRQLLIRVRKMNPEATSILTFTNFAAKSKHDVFAKNAVTNYINLQTLLSLTSEQSQQLKELYNVGHRNWILGGLRDIEKHEEAVFNIIKSHPTLSKSKFIFAMPHLASNKFCDLEYYKEQGGDTLNHAPVNVLPIGSNANPRVFHAEEGVRLNIFLNNCAKLFPAQERDETGRAFARHLQNYTSLIQRNRELFIGVMTFDEPAHHGVSAEYAQDIYRVFNSELPNLPIIITESFYIGSFTIANKFINANEKETAKKYFNPKTVDGFYFDHYSMVAISRGSVRRQEQMRDFLKEMRMLTKPYVKMLSGVINKSWPCEIIDPDTQTKTARSVADFKKIYTETNKVFQELPDFERNNGAHNVGFWAFFSGEAFENNFQPSWTSTLAHQENGFCPNQYQAVLDYSRDHYVSD